MTIVPESKTPEAVSKEAVVEEDGATSKEKEVVAEKESTDGEPSELPVEEQIEAAVKVAIEADREDRTSRSQEDLNKLRSSLDTQLGEARKDWDSKEGDYRSEIHRLNMANMDEGEKKEYELQLVYEEVDRLKDGNEELQTRLNENRTSQDWLRFFTDSGVDPSKMDTTQGLQSIIQSGMTEMTTKLKDLEGQLKEGGSKVKETVSSDNKKAPKVVTKKGTVSTPPGWEELIKKHGSEERVYQLVQEGSLPGTIIPGGSEDD